MASRDGTSLVARPETGRSLDVRKFLAEVVARQAQEYYRQKQAIYSQGEPADSVFYIQEGDISLTVISNHGKEAVLCILGEGDFLGEGCLAGQPVRNSTATALIRSCLLRFPKQAFSHLLRARPEFSQYFISYLLASKARTQEDLLDQLFSSSEKRLARVLLSLARRESKLQSETVLPRISQQVLADMIGTTRSRVSYFMTKFRKQGFVDYRGELRIRTALLADFLRD